MNTHEVAVAAMLAIGTAAAQTSNPLPNHFESAKPEHSTIPHTSDGVPDLQGIWTNATLTRLERPPELADRSTLTDEEAREFEKRDIERAQDPPPGAPLILGNLLFVGANVGYNVLFIDRGAELARADGLKRSSLIVDPSDGKSPALTPEVRRRNSSVARIRFNSIKALLFSLRSVFAVASLSTESFQAQCLAPQHGFESRFTARRLRIRLIYFCFAMRSQRESIPSQSG
jgi:hypothetical protein